MNTTYALDCFQMNENKVAIQVQRSGNMENLDDLRWQKSPWWSTGKNIINKVKVTKVIIISFKRVHLTGTYRH